MLLIPDYSWLIGRHYLHYTIFACVSPVYLLFVMPTCWTYVVHGKHTSLEIVKGVVYVWNNCRRVPCGTLGSFIRGTYLNDLLDFMYSMYSADAYKTIEHSTYIMSRSEE